MQKKLKEQTQSSFPKIKRKPQNTILRLWFSVQFSVRCIELIELRIEALVVHTVSTSDRPSGRRLDEQRAVRPIRRPRISWLLLIDQR